MERARWTVHRGHRILFVDYSGLQNYDDVLATIEQAKQLIVQEPENSVLILSFIRDAKLDATANQAIKDFALHNQPYACAGAVVGASPIHRLLIEAARIFSNRDLHAFDTLAKAKEWLIQQSRLAGSAEQTA